jgi:hypothetical protein
MFNATRKALIAGFEKSHGTNIFFMFYLVKDEYLFLFSSIQNYTVHCGKVDGPKTNYDICSPVINATARFFHSGP